MTPDMLMKLRNSLVQHEGFRNFPYTDTVGKITIGIGYNLSDRGLDNDWINHQYEYDVNYFYTQLNNTFPWFSQLNSDRQIVLIDMCFMGWKRFLEFQDMISALSKGDYEGASQQMLNSEWAQQTKSRAQQLAQGMSTGVYAL